ncbi:aldo/keto reductase [Massilimicrobiota sp. An105]|uniref:aldo/keto reductase n=1 Tax=Massilimicrobiota sp. An105 TaxID=1965540 RepID=UPI000B37E50E|nr:aldo/keto reductase [Massilimicrobiota sp. An105]OUQ79899.1 aldo/keto reductase [Massilimicrobiota sp. An105]
MEKRFIGQLEVSPIGMGCMGFSHGYGQIPNRTYSIEAIRKAYEFGCTFFDTAETYGRELYWEGHNEEILGEAVEPFRNEIVLATKLHIHDEEVTEDMNLYDLIKGHLLKSLKRLRTEYVDLYYLHRITELVPVEDVASVMGKLIDESLIKGWGLSQVDVDTLDKAHKITPVTAVQNLYNILERDCEDKIFPYCLENNIGVVPFSPIASGFLSGKITTQTEFEKTDDVRNFVPQLSKENIAGNQPILDILNKFAKIKNATLAQISLAWMLKKYPNVVPIPGSKNQERIIENLGAWNVELTDEEFNDLQRALDQCEIHGHRGIVETQHQTFSNNWRKS